MPESGGLSVKHLSRGALLLGAALSLGNCASQGTLTSHVDPRYGVAASPRIVEIGESAPKGGGTYRIGKPYQVAGRTFVPQEDRNYSAEGIASWYGPDFHGRLTANGEVFDMNAVSAAHPTLPIPSYVRVTNQFNRKSLIVRVNDRGPFHDNRVIDLSSRAADLLGYKGIGLGRVRVEYVGPAPLEGSDDTQLVASLRDGVPAPAPSLVRIASAKPFVPTMTGLSDYRGLVPVPSGRPYGLGTEEAARRTQEAAAADSRRADNVNSRTSPLVWSPGAPPATAFASPQAQAVMGGRGLY